MGEGCSCHVRRKEGDGSDTATAEDHALTTPTHPPAFPSHQCLQKLSPSPTDPERRKSRNHSQRREAWGGGGPQAHARSGRRGWAARPECSSAQQLPGRRSRSFPHPGAGGQRLLTPPQIPGPESWRASVTCSVTSPSERTKTTMFSVTLSPQRE